MTSSDVIDEDAASRYDREEAAMFAPARLDPALEFLAQLAGDGPALEFAIGTGRVAVPLLRRGVAVTGVELSPAMVKQLRRRATATELPVTIGDMATTGLSGEFSLVYLLWNGLMNLRTQGEQVACFQNAAKHLTPGGRFVVELELPSARALPMGWTSVAQHVDEQHLLVDVLDVSSQQGTSHHYRTHGDGSVRHDATNFRYVWPAECDLMAQLAGMKLEQRFSDWAREPFTAKSASHVSVWRRSFQADQLETPPRIR